jgi:hypothetical protein
VVGGTLAQVRHSQGQSGILGFKQQEVICFERAWVRDVM